MSRHKYSALTMGLTLALGIFATDLASAAEAVSVRLKWLPQAQFAGVYMAQEKGFYKDAGLDVTINPGGPNIAPETLVASGSDTFGILGGTEVILFSREKGLPLVAVGMLQQISPHAFVAYDDSGIESVQDFKGKRVATWFAGPQYTLFSMLAAEDVDQADVDIVSQPFSMQPFIEKQFDVAMVTTYNELNVLREGGINNIRLFYPGDSGVISQQDAIATSEQMIRDKPEVVQAFVEATLKGWKYAFENKEETIDTVLKSGTGLERRHQELMLDELEKLMVVRRGKDEGLGAIDLESISAVQDNLVAFEGLKAPVDLSAAFDTSFWEKTPAESKKVAE
ncbi:ABC transporter substrate-binding protein [Aureimonas fodinaquatilis]|uniref:Thiamine pyrimidine synthase n=1 Tax=Aureimonas fodinaquatilis TaxID=2565783 RepID=A0A5B0DWQ8_9HYPH|nr:ABC transporter substrate-binding protein [Aureimonas fodinaquatilis]KAA0969639.1 ABC transporter substrate-binding protein [Aureimonas fodinaquatilis]